MAETPDYLRGETWGRSLTPREWQVLAASGRTDTVQDIANVLGCSFDTAKGHVAHINAKLGTRTQKGALRWAGFLSVPEDDDLPGYAARAELVDAIERLRDETERLLERLMVLA